MPESPITRLVRNILTLERIANTVATESQQQYRVLFDAIIEDLRELDPTSPPQETYRRLRTEKFIDKVRERLREFAPKQERLLKDRLAVVGRQQAKEAEATLIASIGDSAAVTPTPITQQRVRAILNTDPFRGRLLKEHTERMAANTLTRVRDQIRIGMVNEESIPDMVRRIRGRRAGSGFTGGVLQTSTREAEALVRTAVNHVSNEGMMGTYNANADVLSGIEYVAFLDDRTTVICLNLDGSTWPLDSPDIKQPPQHYNCRSVLTPLVDWEGLGMDEPPEPTRAVRDTTTGKIKQIPASRKAEFWLQQQPKKVQEELLGVEKARLFRNGEISLKDLVRSDNSTVPLSELGGVRVDAVQISDEEVWSAAKSALDSTDSDDAFEFMRAYKRELGIPDEQLQEFTVMSQAKADKTGWRGSYNGQERRIELRPDVKENLEGFVAKHRAGRADEMGVSEAEAFHTVVHEMNHSRSGMMLADDPVREYAGDAGVFLEEGVVEWKARNVIRLRDNEVFPEFASDDLASIARAGGSYQREVRLLDRARELGGTNVIDDVFQAPTTHERLSVIGDVFRGDIKSTLAADMREMFDDEELVESVLGLIDDVDPASIGGTAIRHWSENGIDWTVPARGGTSGANTRNLRRFLTQLGVPTIRSGELLRGR